MTKEELIKEIEEEYELSGTITSLIEVAITEEDKQILAKYLDKEKGPSGKVEKLRCYIVTDHNFIKIYSYGITPEVSCGYKVCPLSNFVSLHEDAILDKNGHVDPAYRAHRTKRMEVTVCFDATDEDLRKVMITTREKLGNNKAIPERKALRIFVDKFREAISPISSKTSSS